MKTLHISIATIIAFLYLGGHILCADEKVTGLNLAEAEYAKGSFKLTRWREKGDKEWVERNKDGKHDFVEVKRDESAVYLRAVNRDVNIILDLEKMKVLYSTGKTPPSEATELYTITSVTSSKRF